jgi:uridine kinase
MGLAASIPDSVVIQFDRYPVQMPEDLASWRGDGADFNLWSAPGLAEDLARARDGDELVVFEAPLGRRHALTGAHIDFLVFIEIPLEIAVARLVRRELAGESDRLVEYIDAYEAVARDVYREQSRQVAPDADLVVDGRPGGGQSASDPGRARLMSKVGFTRGYP